MIFLFKEAKQYTLWMCYDESVIVSQIHHLCEWIQCESTSFPSRFVALTEVGYLARIGSMRVNMQNHRNRFGYLWCMTGYMVIVGFVINVLWTVGCSPTVATECSNTKPCATGKVCNAEGKCIDSATEVSVEQPNTSDATAPEESVQEAPTATEVGPEPQPETTPDASKPIIYRWVSVKAPKFTNLHAASMPTETHAWVVGEQGTVMMSSDGGKTWNVQDPGFTGGLYAVHFIDTQKGWIGGDQGQILRTKDGGKTWQKLTSTSTERIRSIRFFNDQLGFAAGHNFTFLNTRDAGDTWQARLNTVGVDLHGVSIYDKEIAYIVGATGFIAVTLDGGLNVTTAVTGTNTNFWGVDFVGETEGWAVGDGGLVRYTDNRGSGWVPITFPLKDNLYGVDFISQQMGWVIGANGTLMITQDKGKTWLPIDKGKYPDLHGISVYSAQRGVIVGKNGTILVIQQAEADCSDGATQKCYTGPAGTANVGVCKEGTQQCADGVWGKCTGEVLPASQEICFNGKDDNCNGKDDDADGCAPCQDNQTRDCFTGPQEKLGTGVCRAGKETCLNGKWGTCQNQVLPGKEECNGKDDDCDGQIDNGLKREDGPPCSNSFGVCGTGYKTCVGGKWAECTTQDYGPDYEKTETKCDGKDNDCNGVIDEGCPCTKEGESKACYTGPQKTAGVGECKEGKQSCTNGKWTNCEGQVVPTTEICGDKKDNDCNGAIDEQSQYALDFSANQRHHVVVASASALEPTSSFTLEGWFLLEALNNRAGLALVSKSESSGYALYLDLPSSGNLGFRVWEKGAKDYTWVSASYKGLITTQKWAHIAVTYDGTDLTLWLDGKKLASKAFKGPIDYSKTGIPFIIGAEASSTGGSSNYFSGQIAQLHVANKALYTQDFTPNCNLKPGTDTVAFWGMDEGFGDTIGDSTSKHEGQRKGAVWKEAIRCPGFAAGGCQTKP